MDIASDSDSDKSDESDDKIGGIEVVQNETQDYIKVEVRNSFI